MEILERYRGYAAAFEATFEDDDWSRIEPYFTENAVYEPGQSVATGRSEVLAALKAAIDGFDRKMDTRVLEFVNVAVQGNEVHVDWEAHYTREEFPDLVLKGQETAVFEGDRISSLREEWEPDVLKRTQSWMREYGDKL